MRALAVEVADPVRDADLAALALRIARPILGTATPAADRIVLARDATGLVLRALLAGGEACVRVTRARAAVSRSSSLLARAVGRGRAALVVDATAGLARDAQELAALGYRVVACERHPVLAFMLRDTLARTAPTIDVRECDARDVLAKMERGSAHAVLLDPMFPPRDKSAAVRKEAQVLQQLLGHEPDAADLFDLAWHAASRIVVKRSLRAAPLRSGVSFAVTGRAVRFDVYLTAGRTVPPAPDP